LTANATFEAFGGTVVVAVTDPDALEVALRLATAEAHAFDRACSRFRPDSELSRLNQAAGLRTRVGPILGAAIEVALRAAIVSDGLVDLTIGRALVASGYDRDFAHLSECDDQPGTEAPVAGWHSVQLDATRREVLMPAGTLIDLGATAKALYSDRAARLVLEHTGRGALVSAGGDVALAGPPPAGGWLVGIAEHHAGAPHSAVFIERGGVATSGTTARRWTRGNQALHHIIDPRTGRSAAGCWRTVTVAAGSAVDANIAATAAVVLDLEAPNWLARRHLPALLIHLDGRESRVCGWPDAGDGDLLSAVAGGWAA